MKEQDRCHQPTQDELVQYPFYYLGKLHRGILNVSEYLNSILYQDDTSAVEWWKVMNLHFLDDPVQDKEAQVIESIFSDLGDRYDYYTDWAHSLRDFLLGLGAHTEEYSIRIQAIQANEPIKTTATRILKKTQARLDLFSERFEDFLQSSAFRKAFSVKVDRTTGEYQIKDLNLDPNEIREKCYKWLGIETDKERKNS